MKTVWKGSDVKKRSFRDLLDAFQELIGMLFWGGIILFLIAYVIPAVIFLAVNFYQLVIAGTMKMSEFRENIAGSMFNPINQFYGGIWDWFQNFLKRVTS